MTENDSVELRSLDYSVDSLMSTSVNLKYFMNIVNSKLFSEVSADVNVFIAEFAELRSLGLWMNDVEFDSSAS